MKIGEATKKGGGQHPDLVKDCFVQAVITNE